MSGGFGFSKSKSSSDPAFPTEIRALAAIQTKLSELGLDILESFQADLPEEFAQLSKELSLFKKASDEIAGDINIDVGDMLSKFAIADFENATNDLGTSQEDLELIGKIADEQVASLSADVQGNFRQILKKINANATKRGLRTDTDSPVGAAAGAEGARLVDSLSRDVSKIRSTQFQAELGFGLEKAKTRAGLLAAGREGVTDIASFRQALLEDSVTKQSEFLGLKSGILTNLGAVSSGGTSTAISGLARAFTARSKSFSFETEGGFKFGS